MKRLTIAMGVLAVGWVGSVQAESGLHTRADRPYIVEVGDPQFISANRLEREMRRNEDLRNYVDDYGMPDAMEVQRIVPQEPWADYEVRIYYLDTDQSVAFGNALFTLAPEVMDFGITKYIGPIRPEDRERIAMYASSRPGPASEGDALTRVINAADRAAAAAEAAEAASAAAAASADRAVRITERMEAGFKQGLRK